MCVCVCVCVCVCSEQLALQLQQVEQPRPPPERPHPPSPARGNPPPNSREEYERQAVLDRQQQKRGGEVGEGVHMIPSERASQGKQNGANFISVAPSNEELYEAF